MKESELRRALKEEFGEAYSQVIVRDHWLRDFGGTPSQMLASGTSPRDVWVAVCDDFDVPLERRHGRGMMDPKKK